jgi:DNA-directed RNA polymerase specialized sigma24 family protein
MARLEADALPVGGLPVPDPETVRDARAHLTPRHATGVDEILWETRKRPMPDGDAVEAVITASDRAQQGAGQPPEVMDVAAALVVLSAIRLNLDQTEARLLNTAQAAGMSFEQIAAILDLSVEEAEERHRRLKPRLDESTDVPR